ncbi:MAG: CZB domain-containing protein [Phenylobacterium sp.]|uniref:CZB domain-containing protein n=1 Tax=Phenylobacterium sp. TaxID=1871053 RepID=UPI00391A1B41
MDFDKATAAHADWKVKLRMALMNGDTLDAETLCSDKHCDLGRWLHGEGRARFAGRPAFGECVEAHKDFHEAAAGVARAINRKDFAAAETLLGAGSRFGEASSKVAVSVRRLKREVEDVG